ncbi:MAG: hypothetical protein IK130_01430 [Oscillospiraceae bacterium]|nr:hypothetical protein [Oscillospiraceae bacterium]
MQKQPGEYLTAFLLGFFIYTLLEITGRGRTHWTMGILGGIVLAVLYSMEGSLPAGRIVRALLGAVFVTSAEFTAGVFDNLIMEWDVWDYSDRPLNILGQVCPLFSLVWVVLCFLAGLLCTALYEQFHPDAQCPN